MRKKAKIDVFDNSGSDKSDNLKSLLKSGSHTNDSPKKKPKKQSDKYKESNLEQRNEQGEQNSENEPDSENASDENVREATSVNSIFNIEELSLDDEIYLLQCPDNYKKQNLCYKNIDFTKLKHSINYGDEVYQLELLSSGKKFITLAVPKKTCGGSLIKMPLKGLIIINKVVDAAAVKSKGDNGGDNYDKHEVVFPEDVKVRHPLLGVEWKNHVDLAHNLIKKEKYYKKKNKLTKNKCVETMFNKLKRKSNNSEIVHKKKKVNS